ncbi:hypothetical protein MANES_10G123900v8 [Manihot esculenta]|uniref:TF-B3 domain-containing protein n=1 Tax=Manihot esculenta TaxID=3983 RepID=A0A2C9V6Y4_MANES|nr:hypothetical protein MANES_10G123900v8 [Manihot esculenta]
MATTKLVLFSKMLTRTDIESGLCISTSSLSQLPFDEGQQVNMHVHDEGGREWIFPCTIKEDENVGRFLSVGWLDFVRFKDLRAGDQVNIHEEVTKSEVPATLMKIRVQRKIRLFGVDIWAAV